MTKITYYEQVRVDGGKRIGIEVNEEPLLGEFHLSKKEPNAALLWYVDIDCKGTRLPEDAEEARQWLLDHESAITGVIRKLAKETAVGTDPDVWSAKETLRGQGYTTTVRCSALRRIQSRQFRKILGEISDNWQERVANLPQLESLETVWA
ncbi:MAG: hypothetical protein FWD53_00595 [Phycisphaerales bacterium]|nr:hypothetical protein [Phycisphaerales bacterium]